MKIRHLPLFGLALLGAALLSVTPALAANECEATITGNLERKETGETKTKLTGVVEVSVEKPCATVRYDLVVVEEITGGEKTEVRVSREVKVRGAKATQAMEYEIRAGRKVVGHRLEQTSCELCE